MVLGHETYESNVNGGGMGGGQWGPDFNPFTDIFNTDNIYGFVARADGISKVVSHPLEVAPL
ncbi:hypothetical protein CsSME_00024608 [Camellia sinensis var. sinensis]